MLAGVGLVLTGLIPTPHVNRQSFRPLFGPEQFVALRGFGAPDLVRALASDVDSLQQGLADATASPQHGSVEWMVLDPETPPQHEPGNELGTAGRACLFRLVEALRAHIEDETGILLDAHCELKYAYYPCGGRYQRHIDGMNVGSVAREYSFILYLNEGWSPSHGGFLRAYNLGGVEGHTDIPPAAGTQHDPSHAKPA